MPTSLPSDPSSAGPLATARPRHAHGGPQTAAGKAVASRNAITHGIFSNLPVIPGFEHPDDWEAHRTSVSVSLDPRGAVETALAERAALLLWRLKRLARYETDAAAKSETAAHFAEQELDRALDRVMRYESHLSRQLHTTLDRLAALQRRRLGASESSPRRGRPPRLYAPSDPRFRGFPDDM